MSSVSGVGTSALYQYFQGVQSSQSNPTSAAQSASGTASTSSTNAATGTQSAGHAHGHRRHQGASDAGSATGGAGAAKSAGNSVRFQQIRSAVVSALQSAQSNPSADPNKVVTGAIASIFKNNQNVTSTSTSDVESGSDEESASGSITAESAEQSDFAQTLQENGIDPDQFQQDFQSAVQQAQGGQVDPSTAFRSFPPGLIVDTTA